ncbi:MAG: CU044_2847 family protein [Thainema sp.]
MQPTLIPIELEDGTTIHIQADAPGRITRDLNPTQEAFKQSFSSVYHLVRGYTLYTVQAFKNLGAANVSQVELEFGVSVSAKSGVPYIASGTADCNVKISVTCKFPDDKSA